MNARVLVRPKDFQPFPGFLFLFLNFESEMSITVFDILRRISLLVEVLQGCWEFIVFHEPHIENCFNEMLL